MRKDKSTQESLDQTIAQSKIDISNIGFSTIKDFFSNDDLNNFETIVVDLYLIQAKKIGEYRKKQ